MMRKSFSEDDYLEKVYHYQGRKSLTFISLGIALLFLFLLFFVMRKAMAPAPWHMALVMDIFTIILPVLAIIAFTYPPILYPYFAMQEVVFSEGGVVLKRGHRSITIQKITDLSTRKFRGKEVSITITGLGPDGEKVRKTLVRKSGGDVEKRWDEFKEDLQKLKSK